MAQSPKDVIREAQKELAGGGFMPGYEPTWHPYYWLGRLNAAKEIEADDRLRRRDLKPKATRPARGRRVRDDDRAHKP